MTWQNPIALLQNKISLFVLLSAALHSLLLLNWKDPLQFDFGGQQLNQQRIEIALAPPAPEQPQEPPQEETPHQPTPPPQPEPEVAIEEVVEAVVAPEPEPKPVVKAPTEGPSRPVRVEPTPQPQPKPEPKPVQPRKQPVPFQQQKIAQQASKKRAKHDPSEKQQTPPPKPVEKTEKKPLKKVAPKPAPKAVAEAEKVQQSEAIQQSRATIRRLIQAELVRYFQYPRLARRNGWEGKVHLEFTVEPNGKLSNIHILTGSRHGLLNRSAIDTMKRINQLNQVSEGMLGSPLQMEIPIIYQLQ